MNWIVQVSAAALLACLMSGCGLCSDEVASEVVSPDGVLAATWFVRNCGATTDFSSIVSVHRKSEGYRDDQDIVFVVAGRAHLVITWIGPNTLSIECADCRRADIFRQVAAFGSVDIMCQLPSSSVPDR